MPSGNTATQGRAQLSPSPSELENVSSIRTICVVAVTEQCTTRQQDKPDALAALFSPSNALQPSYPAPIGPIPQFHLPRTLWETFKKNRNDEAATCDPVLGHVLEKSKTVLGADLADIKYLERVENLGGAEVKEGKTEKQSLRV